jgi:hypothetical protein
MSRVDVTPETVGNAARNFAIGQKDLVDAWMRLQGALDANAGMAGNDNAATVFNHTYQPAVGTAWKVFRQAIVVLGGTSLGLTHTANNHIKADHHSRADRPAEAPNVLGPNGIYPDMSMASPRSAIGPAYLGDFGVNGIMAKLLVGYWPAANPGKLEGAAKAWHDAASEINKIAGWLNWTINGLADENKGHDFAAIQGYWARIYKSGDTHSLLVALQRLCTGLGDACSEYADTTGDTEWKIDLAVDEQEVILAISFGTEAIVAQLARVVDPIVEVGVATVGRVTGAAITDEIVAGAEAAAAGTPKIEPIEAQFDTTAGRAIEDEMAAAEQETFANSDLAKATTNGQQRGLAYEAYLRQKLGGADSFSNGGREFDGQYSTEGGKATWYEAKSGQALDNIASDPAKLERFKSTTGEQAALARRSNVDYEVISENPIPETLKSWLDKKGIPYRVIS